MCHLVSSEFVLSAPMFIFWVWLWSYLGTGMSCHRHSAPPAVKHSRMKWRCTTHFKKSLRCFLCHSSFHWWIPQSWSCFKEQGHQSCTTGCPKHNLQQTCCQNVHPHTHVVYSKIRDKECYLFYLGLFVLTQISGDMLSGRRQQKLRHYQLNLISKC